MNGGEPPVLSHENYSIICDGELIEEGPNSGCIEVDSVNYWMSVDGSNWEVNEGSPGTGHVKIDAEVWANCSASGNWKWHKLREVWEDGETLYRWKPVNGWVQTVEVTL
jgi:hypothetical protein